VRWDDLTSPELGALAADPAAVVIVPVGATEQHGPHLPVSTDARCAEDLALRTARSVAQVPVVVAPAFRYGASDEHLGFAGTLSIPAELLETMLVEIALGIVSSGFGRVLFLNGHGGNDRLLYYALRRIRARSPRAVALAATTYWKIAADELRGLRRSAEGGMGHACELETSLMLFLDPDHVHADRRVTEVPIRSPFRGADLLSAGTVYAPDRFSELTSSGVAGDPSVASVEQGERFADAIVARLVAFVDEFAGWALLAGGEA
jgi:creatinine amidohydrolase